MSARLLVINPNSNAEVTAAIDRAMAPLRTADAPAIDCITLTDGPPGIESQRSCDLAAALVSEHIAAASDEADAFVVACYSDPGVSASREVTAKPIFGAAESAMATAASLGVRAGVISILDVAVARHWRHARSVMLAPFVVADLPIGLPVSELADEVQCRARMLDVGRRLKEAHGAEAIILGCAGMARYRAALEAELGVVVIDPTQAAAAMAISALRLGYRAA